MADLAERIWAADVVEEALAALYDVLAKATGVQEWRVAEPHPNEDEP